MIDFAEKTRTGSRPWTRLIFAFALVIFALTFSDSSWAAPRGQKVFKTAEEAVSALLAATKTADAKEMTAIMGPRIRDIFSSGDSVADKETRDLFIRSYEEKHSLQQVAGDKMVLFIGAEDWPFPIPVVKKGKSWRFDTRAGLEEILDRRIGKNELGAIQVCLSYVDAQRDYASRGKDKGGLLEYAQKFISDPGKKNGLYWEAAEGEEQSPMGPFMASAAREGYRFKAGANKPSPYHGYFYRIIKAQGPAAPGGAYDYMVRDSMIGGFALVAWPAKYGVSGVMTFIVNHGGNVYEKNLGKDTAKVARHMTTFDPDKTWKKLD